MIHVFSYTYKLFDPWSMLPSIPPKQQYNHRRQNKGDPLYPKQPVRIGFFFPHSLQLLVL